MKPKTILCVAISLLIVMCLVVAAILQFGFDNDRLAKFVSPIASTNEIWFTDGDFLDRDFCLYAKPKGQKTQFVASLAWFAAREALLTSVCGNDTFALDLISEKALSDLPVQHSAEARVSQKFRMNREKVVTLYSPVFTLDGPLIQTYIKQNRELFGK
jgi:hypothetical protein